MKCYNVYLWLLNFILYIPCFEHMKFVCSGYQWPSFLWLIFLGTASVLPSSYQGVPMLVAILAIYCWSYPTLPFPWRGRMLWYCNTLWRILLWLPLSNLHKKKKMHTTAGTVCIWQSDIFCVFHTSGEGNWSLEEKAYICQDHHYFSPLTSIFSLSLLFCKTDYQKQILEAEGKKWRPMGCVYCEKCCLGFS